MRQKKATADEILSYLSDGSEIDGFMDDSDADKTWLPPSTNKVYEEDDDSDYEIGQVSDHDNSSIEQSTSVENIFRNSPNILFQNQPNLQTCTSQSQTQRVLPNTGWAQIPFIGVELPDRQYGPHPFKLVDSAYSYIKKYLPDAHVDEAALYTNMYAMSKSGKELKTNANEIKVLNGIHAMIGIIKYP